jgi:hypothetical protein
MIVIITTTITTMVVVRRSRATNASREFGSACADRNDL